MGKLNIFITNKMRSCRGHVAVIPRLSRGLSSGLNSTSKGQDLDRIIVDRTNTSISQGQIEYFIKNESFIGHYMVILWSSGGPQRLEGPL
jgi:hypothetical protein